MCGTTCGLAAFKHPDSSPLTHQPTCTQPCKHTHFNSAAYCAGRNSPLFSSSELWSRGAKPAWVHVACFGLFRRIPYKFGFERDSNICRGGIVPSNCPPPPQRQTRESAAATRPPIQTYPAVDDGHVERVGVQPALHCFADGADLVQRRSVHVWPTRVQSLEAERSPPSGHNRSKHSGAVKTRAKLTLGFILERSCLFSDRLMI